MYVRRTKSEPAEFQGVCVCPSFWRCQACTIPSEIYQVDMHILLVLSCVPPPGGTLTFERTLTCWTKSNIRTNVNILKRTITFIRTNTNIWTKDNIWTKINIWTNTNIWTKGNIIWTKNNVWTNTTSVTFERTEDGWMCLTLKPGLHFLEFLCTSVLKYWSTEVLNISGRGNENGWKIIYWYSKLLLCTYQLLIPSHQKAYHKKEPHTRKKPCLGAVVLQLMWRNTPSPNRKSTCGQYPGFLSQGRTHFFSNDK